MAAIGTSHPDPCLNIAVISLTKTGALSGDSGLGLTGSPIHEQSISSKDSGAPWGRAERPFVLIDVNISTACAAVPKSALEQQSFTQEDAQEMTVGGVCRGSKGDASATSPACEDFDTRRDAYGPEYTFTLNNIPQNVSECQKLPSTGWRAKSLIDM
ncbi:hypothetical protein L210DRAFT_3502359 [Boletus edulis BED1]|uniref:Uncharacterized protein n=1 Tax=Boletus edulis BED1 TaxID=1328754 RepID=A0AAD4GI17_BOLED|nr:hypothetical protein L210DRAFT_3502359 [Boletus edulis BED1]